MKTLDLTRDEIKTIIDFNKIPNNLNRGTFGLCCNYDDNIVLKFDLSVLQDFKEIIDFSNGYISQINIVQINRLCRLSDKIKLTTMPLGIAYCENVPVAVMLKYFNNHRNLLSLPCELKDNLFHVLFSINDVVDELCQNYIYQLDISERNFLYSKTNFKPEAIDLDGMLVDVSNCEKIRQEELIYERLIEMYMHIIMEKMVVYGFSQYEIEQKMIDIKKYYFGINGYYGTTAFLRGIKEENILRKIK